MKLLSQNILLILAFVLCSSRVSNIYDDHDFSFQVRGLKENSTLVIKDDFSLSGKTVIIPKNCTLRFDGGSLSNGTIVFQNTRLLGDPRMDIHPKGSIIGRAVVNWFGLKSDDVAFDNGPIFNEVGQIFSSLYVEPGDYYCKTPIDWSNNVITNLVVDGNLHYVKANTSDTFITLRTTRGIVCFNGSILGPTQKITDNNTKERSVGICFKDCNNSKIFLKTTGFFFKNILVMGSSAGIGNAYNDSEFIESYAAKILVHIASEKKGWASSNVFRILRLTSYGGYTVPETGLLIQGEDTAENGGFSDTVIDKLCIEGLKRSEPIKIIGANHFVIDNIRNEANYPTLCYCKNVIEGKINTNYVTVTIRPDNKSKVSVISSSELDDYSPLDKSYVIDSDGTYRLFNSVDSELKSLVRYSPLRYTPIGIVTTADVLGKPLRIECGSPFTLDVVYFDEKWDKVSITKSEITKPAGNVIFIKSNVIKDGYMSSSLVQDLKFVCPNEDSNVKYVGFFFRCKSAATPPVFKVSRFITSAAVKSIMQTQQYQSYLSSGPSRSRPVFKTEDIKYLIGYQYYDTTLGKLIFAKTISPKGEAVWVDSDGRQM